jgi:6-phosphofructokinase 1
VIRSITNCLVYRYGVKKVIGFKYGFEGLNPIKSVKCKLLVNLHTAFLSNIITTPIQEIIELTAKEVRDIHDLGGTILGSSRGPQPISVMVDYLVSLNVSMLFTIGGDGTLKGANAIAQECKNRGLDISVIGIPKTIDNDISYVEQTFGFGVS